MNTLQPFLIGTCLAFVSRGGMAEPVTAPSSPSRAHAAAAIIAPNTTLRAFHVALPAVVKLYGGGLGREHGYGTGFLVSADGRMVTMQSLLTAGRGIRAITADGRTHEAMVLRTDEDRKLALLKIDVKESPFLEWADTTSLLPGDTVIALGNGFKVAEGDEAVSVNRGILSLKTNLDARRLTQEVDYHGPVLVYDAITANPGSPGGPLVNIEGKCLGIVGLLAEATSTNTRLNYAIPSEEIRAFLETAEAPVTSNPMEPAAHGEPYLGIRLSKLGYRHVSAYIDRITPGSPAALAGLASEDLIVAMDGRRISDDESFDSIVSTLVPGRTIEIIVKRGDQLIRANVVVGERK